MVSWESLVSPAARCLRLANFETDLLYWNARSFLFPLSLSLSLSLCSLKFSLWLGLCFVSICIGRILKYTVLDDVDDL